MYGPKVGAVRDWNVLPSVAGSADKKSNTFTISRSCRYWPQIIGYRFLQEFKATRLLYVIIFLGPFATLRKATIS